MSITRRSSTMFLLAACGLCPTAAPAPAQTADRPALTQIARDVQSLYKEVEAGTVRVRVPLPMLAGMHDLRKWEPQLDAEIRQRLNENRLEGPLRVRVDRVPERQATAGAAAATQPTTDAATHVEPPLHFDLAAPDFPVNEHVGLVLDDKGHVLVNCYIDPRAVANRPIRVSSGNKTVEAHIVGSDRHTRLSVLRLPEPLGKPLRTNGKPPEPGTLVIMFASARQGAGLVLWDGAKREPGLVINVDGAVAGFARGGQFISEAAFKPIADQIIQHGVVKRAKLGAAIVTVATDDPLRPRVPALGDRPAIRVAHVVPDSAAQAGGLRDNDIILSLAGEPVTDLATFAAAIAHCQGDTELKVLRGGEPLTITVKLQPE